MAKANTDTTNKEKKLHGGGWRFLHGLLCALGTLLLLFCIDRTLTMHDWLQNNAVPDGLRASRLSDTAVPYYGTVTELIKTGYTADENMLDSDMAEAIDAMKIPQLISEKSAEHFAFLKGSSDEPMTLTEDEIITPLSDNREALRESCKLVIEDSDIDQLRSGIRTPVKIVNGFSSFYSTALGRAVGRFFVGIPGLVTELVLLALLLWRWIVIMKNSGKPKTSGLRAMGRTIFYPSLICLLLMTACWIGRVLVKSSEIGLFPLIQATRMPLWVNIGLMGSAGLLMMSLGRYLYYRAIYKEAHPEEAAAKSAKKAAKKPEEAPAPALPEAAPKETVPAPAELPKPAAVPLPETKPEAPVPAAAPIPAPAAKAPGTLGNCITCGEPLTGKGKFCIYCGTNQETGANILDELPDLPGGDDEG